eukprot:COSAG01_NODE_2944_length_6814_cov_144.052271_8_plen_98_part_00
MWHACALSQAKRTAPLKDSADFASVFVRFAPFLKLYRPYTAGFAECLHTLAACREGRPAFRKALETAERRCGENLQSLLIRPVQSEPTALLRPNVKC